jgi:acyl-CoA synthetase (AMP-forming)/AMP-acid ligase II
VGRRSDLINVGGNKVSPLEVEQVIRQVRGVADVRVYAKPSSIAGQLVACEIVPSSEQAEPETKRAVLAACQEQLASFKRPRFVEIVDEIKLTDASKRLRREA